MAHDPPVMKTEPNQRGGAKPPPAEPETNPRMKTVKGPPDINQTISQDPQENQNQTKSQEIQSKTRRDAFKIMLERTKNSNQDLEPKKTNPKTKPKPKTTPKPAPPTRRKNSSNQNQETKEEPKPTRQMKIVSLLEPKPNQEIKADQTRRQEGIENQLKIKLKPPTLLHTREPLPTPTNVEPTHEQLSEGLRTRTTDNKTKPKEEKPVNTLQQLMSKAKPEIKTKPVKTSRQQNKPKPKVVEPSELMLFLGKKET